MEVFALVVGLVALGVSVYAVMSARFAQTDVDALEGRVYDINNRLGALEAERAQRIREIAAGGGLVGGGN